MSKNIKISLIENICFTGMPVININLEETELDDSILDLISPGQNIAFIKIPKKSDNGKYIADKIKITPEKLGEINPIGLYFYMYHHGLTDDLFKYCTNLEYLYLGTDKKPMFNDYPIYLSKLPLKNISINYCGIFNGGDGFNEFINDYRLRENTHFNYYI